MSTLLPFFLIILAGLLSSSILRKVHFPWVITLIIGGIIIGPEGLDIIRPDSITEFFGFLGLTFLMFMAGLETKLDGFFHSGKGTYFLSFINGFIPFIVGFGIGKILNYNLITSLLMGIVFISSSIAVIVPALESAKLFNKRIGQTILATSVIQDVSSLLFLSLVLQNHSPLSNVPLYIFYPALIGVITLLKYLLPKIKILFGKITSQEEDLFQEELRSVVLILIGTVMIFELLGLHSIIGGFFAGLVLSDTVTDKVLLGKIRAISYGIFIPTFFIMIGINTQISALFEIENAFVVTIIVVLGSIGSKFFSGFFGARAVRFPLVQSLYFGVTSIPQLSTTLAVSYTANNLGIITHEVNAAFIILSIVSTFLGPYLMSRFDTTVFPEENVAQNESIYTR